MLSSVFKSTLIASTLLLMGVPQLTFAADAKDQFTRDIKILTNWFEGEFDNSEQLWYENFEAANVPMELRAERIHTTHVRLDMPDVGEHVFYVEEYIDHDPSNIIRQRFVIFESDLDEHAIRMKQGFIKEGAKFYGVKNLDKIKFRNVSFLDGCDVFWHRRANQYEGQMKTKACVFGKGDLRRYSVHDMTLSDDKYLRTDSTYLVSDDSFHKGNNPNRPYEMRKANRFECEVSFRPEDPKLSFEEFRAQTQEVKGLSIHSEGGTFSVKRESDGAEFTYLMREKEYPFYAERPEFIYFSIKEEGANRSSAFTVNDIDSRRLGVQSGGLGAFCHRIGYTFDESLELLDSQ